MSITILLYIMRGSSTAVPTDGGMTSTLGGSIGATFEEQLKTLDRAVAFWAECAMIEVIAFAAQQNLWACARSDIVGVLEAATEACKEIATGNRGVNLSTMFTVAGTVASAIGLFTGGASTIVVGVSGIIFSLLGQGAPDGRGRRNGLVSTHGDVLTEMDNMLSFLNLQIVREEEIIRANLVNNASVARTSYWSTDLYTPRVESASGWIGIDGGVMEEIIQVLMPSVSDELARIARQAATTSVAFGQRARRQRRPLDRDDRIGIGRSGPIDEFLEMASLIKRALNLLSQRVADSNEHLKREVISLAQLNAEYAAQFRALADAIDLGYLDGAS